MAYNRNIEKFLEPTEGELQIKEGGVYDAIILDAELDPLECTFVDDDCVEIDTTNLTHIMLTLDNLEQLKRLINEVEEHRNQ